MTTRRGFLRMLGTGAAAAPTIGSEVVAKMAADAPFLGGGGGQWVNATGEGFVSAPPIKSIKPSMLRIIGVPEWLRAEWRERARHIDVFDADIAAMKSMSRSAKIYHQRKRNEQRIEDRFLGQDAWRELRQKFFAEHGFIEDHF